MRSRMVFLALSMLYLSCSDDQPASPGSSTSPAPEFLFVTFGQELATAENWAIHFEPFPSQESISLRYLGRAEKLAVRIAEQKVGSNLFGFSKQGILLRLTTRYDHENLRGGANLQFGSMGIGGSDGVSTLTFTARVPTRLNSAAMAGNDTLEFGGREDDFLIVSYESPTSHRILVDTLMITQSN